VKGKRRGEGMIKGWRRGTGIGGEENGGGRK